MFRTLKPQPTREKKPQKQTVNKPQIVPAPQHPTLQLQSLIGNYATQRMIQRMPTQAAIINTLGKPKKNFGLIKNSTKYKLVLDCVHTYDTYIMQTYLGGNKGEIQAQMMRVTNLLNMVMTAVNAYDGDDGRKATYMQNLKPQIKRDLASASALMMKYISAPNTHDKLKLFIALSTAMQNAPRLYEGDKEGNDRGGTSEVTKYGGANPGFFKANKNTLYDPSIGTTPGRMQDTQIGNNMNQTENRVKEQFGEEEGKKKFNGMKNEYYLGKEKVGIDPQNARMAQRDVAMARLDQLLGGGVIARAQIAVQHTNGDTTEGSLMEKAKGTDGSTMIIEGQFFDPNRGQQKDPNKPQQVSLHDPNLMRLLSRLNLIDLLAMQVDRNRSNFYVQVDNQGKVTGVTGIDNDFSMGTNDDIHERQQELLGISRYVDEELATNIINLDPELLRLVMQDLLTEAEIAALLSRLQKLQEFLKPIQESGNLLKPEQWTEAIAKNLLEERRTDLRNVSPSYYTNLVGNNKRHN